MKTPVFIHHRVNEIARIPEIARDAGAEIDLRSDVSAPGRLHLSHDPWRRGDDFEAWLKAYAAAGAAGPLILNTKEDGLETRTLELLTAHGISNYFFLDTALPTLVKWAVRENHPHFALRVSKHEPVASLASFRGRVKWLWLDCFDGEPLSADLVRALDPGFKLCLVSPELQARPVEEIARFAQLAPLVDAICTKRPDLWKAGVNS